MLKSRLPLVVLAGSVGLFLVMGWLSLSTGDFGAIHDEGIYVVTARSLAVTGEYRIISLPGEPNQRKYPIVFPAMLAAVWRISGNFPANIVWLKAVSLLAGAVFLSLTFGLLRTLGASAWTAVVISGICAVNPAIGEASNNVMSELAFGATSIGALWLLERAGRENPSLGLGLAAGCVAGLAYQTRTIGLALVLAMVIVMSWRRRWRSLAGSMVGVGMAVGICRLWQGTASNVPLAYEYYVNYGNWFLHAVRDIGWRYAVVVPLKNLILWTLSMVRTALPGTVDLSRSVPMQFAAVVAAVLIWSTLVPGWIRRRHEAWAIYLLFYLAIAMMWPFPPGTRSIVPVLPLILLAMWEGFQSVRPSARMVHVTATIAGVIIITSSATGGYVRLTNAHIKPSHHRYEWIRSNTAPGDVIACVLDPNCYLYTGRKAVSILANVDVASFYVLREKSLIRTDKLDEMIRASKAAYVMLEPVTSNEHLADDARELVEKMRRHSPGKFEEVWRDDSEGATIYRVGGEERGRYTPKP